MKRLYCPLGVLVPQIVYETVSMGVGSEDIWGRMHQTRLSECCEMHPVRAELLSATGYEEIEVRRCESKA